MNTSIKLELFSNLNYLNISELKRVCCQLKIPYKIYIETPQGKLKQVGEIDRKGIIIKRIKYYVNTGKIKKPTVFPAADVSLTNKLPATLKASHPILYGEYKNSNKKILQLMKCLTQNEFEFGAVAQEVLRQCWTKGEAPTYQKFADLWVQAKHSHTQPNPEWAFLTDRCRGDAGKDWKRQRVEKANKAIKLLMLLRH